MKKPINFIAIIMVISISIYLYSCREKQNNQPVEKSTNALSTNKAAGICSCDPNYTNPYCQECVWKFMGGGATSKTSTIKWTGCSSTDPFYSQSCYNDGASGAYKSTLTFCYGNSALQGNSTDCSLYMTIDNVPPCVMQCQSVYPYCIKYKVLCNPNGKDFDVTLLDEDPNVSTTISYTISGDPILTICCNKTVGTNTYTYCCTGTFE